MSESKIHTYLSKAEYGAYSLGDPLFNERTLRVAWAYANGHPGMLIKTHMFSKDKWKKAIFADSNGFTVSTTNPDTDYKEQPFQWTIYHETFKHMLVAHKGLESYADMGIQIKYSDNIMLTYIPGLLFKGTCAPAIGKTCSGGGIIFPIVSLNEDDKEDPFAYLVIGSTGRKAKEYIVSYGDPETPTVTAPCI